jgi:phosphoribosylamine--glycine ligase
MTEGRKVLVVGSGGREHAIAWALARSAGVTEVIVAPGNGGTDGVELASTRLRNVPVDVSDFAALGDLAEAEAVAFTVVGPEAPLCAGIVDNFQARGLRCFGPSAAAARLEGSKAFSKAFMARHGIPSAAYAAFTDMDKALAYVRNVNYRVVVKASGLAGGKGVLLPETAREAEAAVRTVMADRAFGAAGDEVVIEEHLFGDEASILAFSDGRTVVPCIAAQDHKRAFDGDRGPNTGGMGAYAPAPIVTGALRDEIIRTVLEPTIEGMRDDNCPFVGTLFVGLMITAAGPRVLEFNVRFGDPETQVVLPLLQSDLADIFEACMSCELSEDMVCFGDGTAATVVMASGGYPGPYEKGSAIAGVREADAIDGVTVFHAGTCREGGRLFTAGGRVLSVTAVATDLRNAVARSYQGVRAIDWPGAQYRKDIAHRALQEA